MSSPAPEQLSFPTLQVPSFGGYAGLPGAIEGVGFWPRVGARVLDLLVHYFVSICAGFLFGVMLAIAAGMTHHPLSLLLAKQREHGWLLFLCALLGSTAYHTVCESLHGSTLGKMAFSMVVVQEDGSPCRFRSALIRSLAYFIDALFFGLIGYFAMQKTPQQQRHGDEWAHTIVCKRSRVVPENLRGGGQFVLALLLATMADAALILLGLLLRLAA